MKHVHYRIEAKEVMGTRLLRFDVYIVGNKKNGRICSKLVLEEWEREYPCNECRLNNYCSTNCNIYWSWLKSNPLRQGS